MEFEKHVMTKTILHNLLIRSAFSCLDYSIYIRCFLDQKFFGPTRQVLETGCYLSGLCALTTEEVCAIKKSSLGTLKNVSETQARKG